MRIVLDVCAPEPFRHLISGHVVVTARHLGLSRLADADLVAAIESEWEVLLTTDRGIRWQNSFAGRNIAVLVLRARTNKLQDLSALVPAVLDALENIQSGEVREIG